MTQFSSPKRALIVRNDFSPFGNKLIQAGYVNAEQLKQALVDSRANNHPLTEVLEALTGKSLPAELQQQYKKQQLFELKIVYGLNAVDIASAQIDKVQVRELINTFISADSCRQLKLLPIGRLEGDPPILTVAMIKPDDLQAKNDLDKILRPHGIAWRSEVIAPEDYQKLLDGYLDERIQQDAADNSQKNLKIEIENFDTPELGNAEAEIDDEIDVQGAEAAPVVKLVNQILAKGLMEKVSDIHVEPQEEGLRVRFRKDGVLRQSFPMLPKHIIPAVISRFKIIAELDIAERRLPQDGRIRRTFEGRKVDFRVSTLPSRYGEKVCMRILDNSSTQLGLDKLISDLPTLEIVREMGSRPFGLILVTGPTGSGKSTTLYSLLAERNDPGVNISTAEDPIEYALPGINQVQVIREKGMNFASILRAFMRQDPDIILVGETRDQETAKTSMEAALTGHMVMTTLHTNDAAGSIARLDEMGVEPFMVSAALVGVVAQRLLRRVCVECRCAYTPSREELARFGLSASGESVITFYKANELSNDSIESAKASGTLCKTCNGIGYRGRVGVYEVMQITDELATLINQRAPTAIVKETAVQQGMKTLLAYSLQMVQEGMTTLAEVERVTFTDSGLEAELKAKRKTTLVCVTCSAELKPEWLDCPYCMTPRFSD
ncbi:GspE/PulE family protein [Chamaesiphon polymorphus]|uniref:General secretion pathway protein GspE n=1 Tax=Chamaesiphon polymorphus CCALA 037 TaxID=2107692 RepID=A0A2T1GC88_9CYAN|nr:GspE/PulE family protein [Chamaesiphon polymorphus]PSB55020.1 general secretion pathway protein GspE [Chamaesiphon polymorphus CCALA 037]